jgi:menaquinone-dependent protoporphyrinogen IX oxidase
MKAVVVYESLTGNTRQAASLIGAELAARGIEVLGVYQAPGVDLGALAHADLVVVGSWVDGIFVVGQRPGRASRLWHLPAMAGKQAAVYCTYAINPGKTLEKMTAIVEQRGATVIGGLAVHRGHLAQDVVDFVNRLTEALAATS